MRNRTEHGLSWLTAISDAGSTPAASTICKDNRIIDRFAYGLLMATLAGVERILGAAKVEAGPPEAPAGKLRPAKRDPVLGPHPLRWRSGGNA
jgi:hypothetical protein